jgi:hypothetical protein
MSLLKRDWMFTTEDGVHGSLEAVEHGDGITITIDRPWDGDSERGFGTTTSFRLSVSESQKLGTWLVGRCALLGTHT